MRIVITRWGLDSYLDLLHAGTISREVYVHVLRPDILRLRTWQHDERFKQPRFWGPATGRGGSVVDDGWKMKWHNVGPGRVQLRLCVGLIGGDAYLCHAYAKSSPFLDRRMAAKLDVRLGLIRAGRHDERGEL